VWLYQGIHYAKTIRKGILSAKSQEQRRLHGRGLAILMGIGLIGFLISTYPAQSLLLVGLAIAVVVGLIVLRNSARKKHLAEQQMPPMQMPGQQMQMPPMQMPPVQGYDTRYIPQQMRQEVWNRCYGACVECGSTFYLEYDHVIPLSKGGATSANNLQLLCRSCNQRKGYSI